MNTCLHDARIRAQGWPAMLAKVEVQGILFRDFDDLPFAATLGDHVDAKVSFEVIQNTVGRPVGTELQTVFAHAS